MKKLAVSLLCGFAALLWLATPRCVFACSCVAPGPPDVEVAQSVAVFAGRVIQVEQPNGPLVSSADPVRVTLQVATVWKGPVEPTVVVQTVRESASCGFPFAMGQDYLVYARGTETSLEVSLCSRTRSLTDAATDMRQLGPGMPAPQDAQSPVPAPPTTDAPGAVRTQTPVAATNTAPASSTAVAILLGIVLLVGMPVVWRIGRRART